MAHINEIVGKYSEAIAKAALMANGFKAVSQSETQESFDMSAKEPLTGEWVTFQCKTIYVREDRKDEWIVNAKKGDGTPYSKSEADYIIGVLVPEGGEMPRVFYFENREIGEYWASEARANKRWVELNLGFNREVNLNEAKGATA